MKIKIVYACCVIVFGQKQVLSSFCWLPFACLVFGVCLNLCDLDTSPQVMIYSYISHIMDSPTSQVDSTCSSGNGDRTLSPVRVGTLILMHNPISSADKPV